MKNLKDKNATGNGRARRGIRGIGLVLCACFLIGGLMLGLAGCGNKNDGAVKEDVEITLDPNLVYYADIEIRDYGTVTVKLDTTQAPITCDNFVKLAQNGFYDGLTFHRIIAGYMMQGGDPNGNGTGGSGEKIVGEFIKNGYDNTLAHTRGAISMARAKDYNSASSQFFIVHQDASPSLDGKYAAFGYVTEGMEVVDAVCEAAKPTDNNGTIPPTQQPVIVSVTIRTEANQEKDSSD